MFCSVNDNKSKLTAYTIQYITLKKLEWHNEQALQLSVVSQLRV